MIKLKKTKNFQLALIVAIIFVLIISFSSVSCKKEVTEEETTALVTTSETTTTETTSTTTTTEPVELIFWMPVAQDDPHIALFKEIDAHMKEKFNISVKFEGQSMDAWSQLLTTAGISQTGPDLLFDWSGQAACIGDAKKNLLQPLNDLLPDGMYDQISGWAGSTDVDGKIYAVPYDLAFAALAFNKSLFDKAGIDYSSYPKLWYWDEFIDVCKKLKEAGINPLGFANKEGYYGEWWIGNTIPPYFNSNEEMVKYFQSESMNSQPMLDDLEKYKTLYDEGYFLREGLTLDHTNNTQQQFQSEKVAMQFTEAMYYKTYVSSLGVDKVGVTFWPYFSSEGKLATNMCGIYNHVIGITPWSQYQKEALIVLQELCATDWGAGKISEILGFTPSYKAWQPSFKEENAWTNYVESVTGLLSKGEAGSYAYDTWGPEFATTIYKFNGMFLSGDMTAAEFAKELDTARGIK